jgi:hypothetical protein
MFENEFLSTALLKAAKGNVADTAMIFALINGYLGGNIPEANFLNDIKVITSTKQ